jgi:hypothetical protein
VSNAIPKVVAQWSKNPKGRKMKDRKMSYFFVLHFSVFNGTGASGSGKIIYSFKKIILPKNHSAK